MKFLKITKLFKNCFRSMYEKNVVVEKEREKDRERERRGKEGEKQEQKKARIYI